MNEKYFIMDDSKFIGTIERDKVIIFNDIEIDLKKSGIVTIFSNKIGKIKEINVLNYIINECLDAVISK